MQSPTGDGELDFSSNWQLDPTELASKFTSRTKALVLNTPNNPLGKVPGTAPSRDLAPAFKCQLLQMSRLGASVSSSVEREGRLP